MINEYIFILFFLGTLSLHLLGDCTLPMENYNAMLDKAERFILACYNMADQESLATARILCWKNKDEKRSH